MPFQTLLIDDEPLAIDRLKRLLAPHENTVQIIDTAQNGEEAIEKIQSLNPDLIFLDIQMPGLNGFEVLEKLEKLPFVIFCTAYDAYALKAFETHAIDYLLKPVEPERLQKSLDKLKTYTANQQTDFNQQIASLLNHLNPEKTKQIKVNIGDRIRLVNVEDILYFQASQKYVEAHTQDEYYLLNQSLNDLEDELPEAFVRIHRSVIVQMKMVEEIIKSDTGNYRIKLINGIELPLSRSARKHLGV